MEDFKFKFKFETNFENNHMWINDSSLPLDLYSTIIDNKMISSYIRSHIDDVEKSMIKINYPHIYDALYGESEKQSLKLKQFLSKS